MTQTDAFSALEILVRERMRLAMRDKVLFERDDQRLNSQLMQGEINMGTAVLGWIERQRQGVAANEEDEAPEGEPEE